MDNLTHILNATFVFAVVALATFFGPKNVEQLTDYFFTLSPATVFSAALIVVVAIWASIEWLRGGFEGRN